MSALAPSFERETHCPWLEVVPMAPVPTSLFPFWDQVDPLRVNPQVAPAPDASASPPESAVLPSADAATEKPWFAFPVAPVPTSLLPCCVQVEPLLVKTQIAP